LNILIVYAHPEPKSFNGAMTDVAVETLRSAGHEVVVSEASPICRVANPRLACFAERLRWWQRQQGHQPTRMRRTELTVTFLRFCGNP
jgi:hypothetical protein